MHRNRAFRRRSALAVLTLLFALSCLGRASAARDILIFGAASTADAINAAISRFDAGGSRVSASYASSGALARQIDNGAPADLYLSANVAWMDWAEKRQLTVPGTISRLFGNRLVLIAPKDSKIALKIDPGFPLLEALQDSRLALADPDHVPAGTYGRTALRNLKVWRSVERRTARTQDVRAALALVERGEAPLGIVYRTDAMASKKVRIVDTFPADTHPPIVYALAIVAGRDSREVRQFYDFLRSPTAGTIFAGFGFQPGP